MKLFSVPSLIFHVTEILYYYNGITGLLPNIFLETPTRVILWRRVLLGVLWDSLGRGETVPGSHFYNVAGLRSAAFLKEKLWRGCFSLEFSKISGGAFFPEHHRKTTSVFNPMCTFPWMHGMRFNGEFLLCIY